MSTIYFIASAPTLHSYLTGVTYPTNKAELLRFVARRRIPGNLLKSIDGIPNGTYLSTTDVLQEIEEYERETTQP